MPQPPMPILMPLQAVSSIDPGKPIRWPGADYIKDPVMNRVDKRLINIIQWTAQSFPLRCTIYSGWRPKSYSHSAGRAIDIVLYDQNGIKLPNYQSPPFFRIYELFGQKSKFIQMRAYRDLDNVYEWGGYFGDNGEYKYKYGSCDLMHYNLDYRGPQVYRAGSLRTGLRGYYQNFYAKGSLVGPSMPMSSEAAIDAEIHAKLNNFRLPPSFPLTYYSSLQPIPNKPPVL